jgi:hypothetical protein
MAVIVDSRVSISLLMLMSSQVKFLLSTQIQNSPPLVPGTGSSRRRKN